MKNIWIALPALLLVGCPASEKKEEPKPVEKPVPAPPPVEPPPPAIAPPPTGAGSIKGITIFTGTPPKPEKVDMKKDPKCIELHKGQELSDVIVTDGKLADVFVQISEGLADQKWEPKKDAVMLDQQGCVYVPQMIAIQVEQPLSVLNSDPLLHNVHAVAKRSEFNQAMPKQGMKIEKKFKAKDLEGKISCEVHPWMHAALRVVEHPYFAVSAKDGTFAIENVPAGKYKVELEHAKLGKKTVDVEVKAGESADANADFGG